jgi:hypothetical protein
MRLIQYCCLILALLTSIAAYGFNEKLLLGKISGQRYTAAKSLFSVEIPFDIHKHNHDNVQIQETVNGTVSNVTFSHKLPDRPLYRMEVATVLPGRERENTFEDAAYETLGWYQKQIEHTLESKITMLDDREMRFNNRQTIFNLFKIPEPKTDYTLYHVFYLSDYQSHVGFCWASFAIEHPTSANENQVIQGQWPEMKRIKDFCSSLKIGS